VHLQRAFGLAVSVVLLVCATVGLVFLIIFLTDDEAEKDGLVVYCTAPAQRGDLLNAAESLGLGSRAAGRLVVDGVSLELADWRVRHSEDFDRACAALAFAQRPPRPSTLATALPFLTGVSSALLAFAAALAVAGVNRGRERAERLRTAYNEMRQAAEAYSIGFDKAALRTKLVDHQRTLVSQLATTKAARPRWNQVTLLHEDLTSGELGTAITAGSTELSALLTRAQEPTFAIAAALEHPLWFHPSLHKKGR
jgi:hypothetical protein